MAKKATTRKRKRTTKPTPAHPDLGKEFYIGVEEDDEVSQAWCQKICHTKGDALDNLRNNVDNEYQKYFRIFRVCVVEVGVDETNPADNLKWYSENTKATKK